MIMGLTWRYHRNGKMFLAYKFFRVSDDSCCFSKTANFNADHCISGKKAKLKTMERQFFGGIDSFVGGSE